MEDVTVQEIAAALYTTPRKAVQQAKDWATELHDLRGTVAWARSAFRLLAREARWDRKLDDGTPITPKIGNAITDRVRLVLDAARLCACDADNPDTCGVCHKHFADCEEDRVWRDDTLPFTREKSEPGCPGARVRAAMGAAGIENAG